MARSKQRAERSLPRREERAPVQQFPCGVSIADDGKWNDGEMRGADAHHLPSQSDLSRE